MKEITRIHIAKTPYEIETAAKKALGTYLGSLEAYHIEAEIIEDIEVRMTEILGERGVKKGGVVSHADVSALKKQLGDPEDFMADGDIAVGADEHETDGDTSRKLYRDGDNAVIGGVLAGAAAFFKINPMWVRLVFILLALMSFGTAILVYAVLWIAVPEAKTAADKLQMAGRPVTVKSIREVNENELGRRSSTPVNGRRVALGVLGVCCVLGAMLSAALTMAALFGVALHRGDAFASAGGDFLLAAFILALVSGLLLSALFILGAYASFAKKFSRRIFIGLCVIVALGLVTFGTAVGLAQYGSMRDFQKVRENTREITIPIPKNMKTATAMNVASDGVRVQYVVSNEAPSAKLRATVERDADMPKVDMKLEKGVVEVTAKRSTDGCVSMWGCDRPVLTIYGPALEKLTAGDGAVVKYEPVQQPALAVTAGRESEVSLETGTVGTLTAVAGQNAHVSVAEATVRQLKVAMAVSSTVEAGTVQTFTLTHENACPSHSREARIRLQDVAEKEMIVNDKRQPAQTVSTSCAEIEIEAEEEK